MTTSHNDNMEGEGSAQGGNDQQLNSTLARMADFFEDQQNKWNGNERTNTEVADDVALERFQKFKPPVFDGEKDEEVACSHGKDLHGSGIF